MALHTLADMRDDVRRLMAIQPGTPTGDPVSYQPDPDNATINSAINQAIEALNRVVRLGPYLDYTISVTASLSTKRSAYMVQVKDVEPPGSGVFHATEIQDVVWTGTDGYTNRLEPFEYYSPAKGYTQFQPYKPGRPAQFISTGTQIGILPPPNTNGTLSFMAASGMDALTSDTQSPSLLPDDYEFALVYWAVMLLSARKAQSIEAQTRYQYFKELASQAYLQVYQWKNGYDEGGLEVMRNILMMTPQDTQAMRQGAQNG